MTEISYCPFCGESEDLRVITTTKKMARLDGTHELWTQAHVRCGHCAARGSSMVEETEAEARHRAVEAWNEAGRLNWWQRNVAGRWYQLQHDLRMICTGGYDLKLLWKSIWR